MKPPWGGGVHGGQGDDSLSTDSVLDILRHPLRRETITYCQNTSDEVTELRDLVDHVVLTRERPGERERVAMELHHLHLPKLAHYGVIGFDPWTGRLRYRPDDGLETLLARIRTEESG